MERDPVCGMTVDPQRASAKAEHAGNTYYFCCKSCAEKFRAEPGKYLQHLRIGNAVEQFGGESVCRDLLLLIRRQGFEGFASPRPWQRSGQAKFSIQVIENARDALLAINNLTHRVLSIFRLNHPNVDWRNRHLS